MGWIVALVVGGFAGSVREFSITGLMVAFVGAAVLLGIVNLTQRGKLRQTGWRSAATWLCVPRVNTGSSGRMASIARSGTASSRA